ncbi:MAG TPA: hypothetical protein GXZ50_05940 [Clostridia bacterium]|nr:hypothetical protein [Clostridia bacterium]
MSSTIKRNKLMDNYGWVQNTSNLSTIRDTIDLVPDHGIRHLELRERIREYRCANNDLPKYWSWDARCRIKAIHACGLVKLNRHIQGYELTDLGQQLKSCPKATDHLRGKRILTTEEIDIFCNGLLTNPPVIRVLELLNRERRTTNIGLTKYEIGEQLGFVGDPGFTHLDPVWIASSGYSFHNKEGDADKWARTILSWLRQVGWAYLAEERATICGKTLSRYKATSEIDNILRYNVKRVERNVPSEMLCSEKHPFPKLIQKRRVVILGFLLRKAQRKEEALILELVNELRDNGIEADDNLVLFEIISLRQAGFHIHQLGPYLKLDDKVCLDVNPELLSNITEESETEIEKLIEKLVVQYEDTIPAKLVDGLVRYGYDGSEGINFEITVAQFFRYLGYKTEYFGQGRGRTADVIARYINKIYARSYGIIIDSKATSDKYTFPAGDIRKMKEYIDLHGRELLKDSIPLHAFAFVSSCFCEDVASPLKEISEDTGIKGTAIEVLKLLEFGCLLTKGKLYIENMYPAYITNSTFDVGNL